MSTGDDWLGVPAVARKLGLVLSTLYRIIDAGDLPAYKTGRVIRIRRADVDEYLSRA